MEVNTFNLDHLLVISILVAFMSYFPFCAVESIKAEFKHKHVTFLAKFIKTILKYSIATIGIAGFIIMIYSFIGIENVKLAEPAYSYNIQNFSLDSVTEKSERHIIKYGIVSVVDLDGKLETFKVRNVQINENCKTSSVEYHDKMWFNKHLYINKETVVVNLDRKLTVDELKAVEESNKIY